MSTPPHLNTVAPTLPAKTELLFREEILAAQGSQWLGAIRLAQPLSTWFIALISLLIAGCLVAYIALGTIKKKARVVGIVIPGGGSLSVMAPNAGLLVRAGVVEGQVVKSGEVLFELSTERRGSHGEITALVGQQLTVRGQLLAAERHARILQTAERHRALDERALNVESEVRQIEQQIALAQRKRHLARQSLEKYETLQANGFVSAAQTQQKLEDLIDIDSRLITLAQTKVQLSATKSLVKSDRDSQSSSLATELVQLDRAAASLNQEVFENQNRRSSLIVAPAAGIVTTINQQPGQAVAAGQVLATFIPKGSGTTSTGNLQVELYAPSRTAGFVAVGQVVLIRYQAFPYQKFGLHEGTVIDISRTPFPPNELPTNVAGTVLSYTQKNSEGSRSNESLYRIKVSLAKQSVLAYGRTQLLKPGMTLDADIVQDERKIWEWIFEPVLAAAR